MERAPQMGAPQRMMGWIVGSTIALLLLVMFAWQSAPANAQQATATETPLATATVTATPFAYEDSDPALIYRGSDWIMVQDPKAHGGTATQARTSGTSMRLQFTGPYFKWYSVRGPNRGRARVSVDGVEVPSSPVDLYKAGDQSYELIVWQGGLNGDTSHTLVIDVLGERSGAATDSLVPIDWLEVQSADRPPITATPTPTPTGSAATAAATATPVTTAASQVTGTPAGRPAGSWPVDSRFLAYYVNHDGLRILGNTISPPTIFTGHSVQYFEKGRIEDQSDETADPNFKTQYGLLADELQASHVNLPVGGEQSTITYASANDLAQASRRVNPPANFRSGTMTNPDGSVFVPYSQALQNAPGHNVSPIFWPYINRADIFPGGWLHDLGLPMTEAMPAVVTKGTLANRSIVVQIFQRTILTYDPLNPGDFQVERANVGTDYRTAFPDRVPQ